ncbi:MAG: sugar nucleotide-binding protein [Proteobacteria bacterium]|nr:sugar nucleotide-binding protein [Pseudomonadota bacterium]
MKTALELWGGHECTVNRVGERYFDQTIRSGHQHRPEDLDRFAALGLKALRYPVLWERTAPDAPEERDFGWADARFARLRDLNIKPIVGLIHHGSGPRYTDLLAENFAPGLAAHARAVAERYPWVQDWTPVNEPLTTARFACVYGLWWPHRRDEGDFFRALLNQIDATRLAMAEIREVNPRARLIQTEDLGFTHHTGPLADQARYENDRRWLTWDLLCGKVTPEHPLHAYISCFGLSDRLKAIAEDPCPPDVVGVNHYLTSERFLDHRVERYPARLHGGNGKQRYVDVEAVRVAEDGPLGLRALLRQAWERYGRTLAVTEAHNGCTREEQMRWFLEAWRGAEQLRGEGIEIEAVTAWSLLGSHGWSNLLTSEDASYECGVFDLRAPAPRPTAMAALLKDLAGGQAVKGPAFASPGWWRRGDIRYVHAPARSAVRAQDRDAPDGCVVEAPPILITGATGTLGQAFARACRHRGLPFVLTGRSTLAIDDPHSVAEALDRLGPSAVINTAGFVRVDDAEHEEDACLRANALGAEVLARACAERGAAFVTFSSDLVFDGLKGSAYVESDRPSPLNAYGRSKAEAEARVLACGGWSLVVRTAAFFSHADPHNFAVHALDALGRGERFQAAEDLIVSPTYVPDLVNACLDLLLDGETGVRCLANDGALSWAAFARALAEGAGYDPDLVEGVPATAFGWPAPRPRDVALASERGQVMPTLESAIERFLHGYAATVGGRRLCPRDEDEPPVRAAAE